MGRRDHSGARPGGPPGRESARAGRAARALLVLVAAGSPVSALAAEIFQSTAVDGVVVQLQVTPTQAHGSPRREATDHRIVALLREQASRRPIADASVVVEVAKAGRAGTPWPLAPGRTAAGPAYVGVVPLEGRGTAYRLRVQFRRPGDAQTFEAEFRYSHH